MKKLTGTDPESRSADPVAENIERLKALFPELVTEGPDGTALNVDVLKDLVSDKTVTNADEKYGLNWHGKRRARQLALTPSTGTLRPCPEDSVDWDTTQNLMIEGDNLEVLKLLQKSYAGKVKLIYIDPPYNTGKDFVYPDNFQDNIRNYLELTGQVEGGAKISSNTEASGRFHTDWLNMMYPRLKVAKYLLAPKGAIFISIDDHEVQNLRAMADEIFGSENFVATVIWQKVYAPKSSAKHFSEDHDYVVVYARDLGFRVFKLDSSNIRAWEPDRDDLDKTLLDSVEHLKEGRTEADVLYELLLKLGLDLCVPIETRTLAGKEVHAVGGGVLMACLGEAISRDDVEPLAQGIVDWHMALAPAGDTTCVFRDSAFADDVAKTNMAAILEQHGIVNVRNL